MLMPPMGRVRSERFADKQQTRGMAVQAELELLADQTTLVGLGMDDELDSKKLPLRPDNRPIIDLLGLRSAGLAVYRRLDCLPGRPLPC